KTTAASASSSRLVLVFARECLNWRWPPHFPAIQKQARRLPAATSLRLADFFAADSCAVGNSRNLILVLRRRDSGRRPAFVHAAALPTTCLPSHSGFYRRAPPSTRHQRDRSGHLR